ncbi:cingulin-like [Pecten maximus]|uniref:cingulin-like n=1 Tax=Pecten maximus TaxID=6579 RepID=UPI001458925F|nr:cingulin-like [Pecten maximus]
MSDQLRDQTDVKITTSIMQKNWSLLKQIRAKDVIDPMIEQSLISIEDSRSILKKETELQQAEALLYLVFSKPQQHKLDAFVTILDKNGYDFVVQQLIKDQADYASKPRTSRQLSEDAQSDSGKTSPRQIGAALMAEMQQQQIETIRQEFQLLNQRQSAELANQTRELKEHHERIVKSEFAQLRQTEEQKKRNEEQIHKLETQLKALQKKLDQERTKMKENTTKSNAAIKELEKERDDLKQTLTKVKHENLYLRNLVQEARGSQREVNRLDGSAGNKKR